MNDLAYLTIKDRIALFRKRMAFSPSDAATKVASIAEAAMCEFMDDDKFVNKGKSALGNRSALYREFCGSLSAAISRELSKTNKSPYESRFGNTYSDYIYIAALSIASLPDRLENDYYDELPPIYYNLRMTLGNYLDALIDISYDSGKGKTNTRRANQYRKLKKDLSGIIDLSTPLCEAIGIILNQYSDSHVALDRLSHVQKCKSALDRYIQMDEMREEFLDNESNSCPDDEEEYETPDEGADEDSEQDYFDEMGYDDNIAQVSFVTDDDFGYDNFDDFNELDPHATYKALMAISDLDDKPDAYFLSEAENLPKASMKSPEKLYFMGNENPNLLADIDYSPEGFKARAAELPPDFREIADKMISARSIEHAFKGMDAATEKLYRILIEPFAEIGKYRFLRHLASDV